MNVKAKFDSDRRSIDELVNSALSEMDEETACNAVCTLQWRGTNEVLLQAKNLTASTCTRERCLGAQILGQLGLPDRTFPVECTSILKEMLSHEKNVEVIREILIALSFHDAATTLPQIARFSTHPDAEIRHAVALALAGNDSEVAIDRLITLSRDPDCHVRDWATFALGTQTELDTPEIRAALVERLQDDDEETRGEAIVGLANRNDHRVIDALKKELASDCVGTLAIEAAERIASNQLYPQLLSLRDWWDVDPELLERAIAVSQE